MPLTPQGKTFSARQKQELPLPYGLPAGREGPSTLCTTRDPHDLYVLYFYNNAASQPALSCPEQNLRRSIERGPFAMCMYVRLNVLPWQPWAGPGWLAHWLADGRTCGCATPPGALLAFATTTRPLAGNGGWMGEGDHCATATRLPPSPPSSSSSGMQLTWDGHVRLVRATEREGVCVCVCERALRACVACVP